MDIQLQSAQMDQYMHGELGKTALYPSACGQLGLSTTRDLPTDNEGYPYQPTPRKVDLLSGVNIVQIACGDAHTVALTE